MGSGEGATGSGSCWFGWGSADAVGSAAAADTGATGGAGDATGGADGGDGDATGGAGEAGAADGTDDVTIDFRAVCETYMLRLYYSITKRLKTFS